MNTGIEPKKADQSKHSARHSLFLTAIVPCRKKNVL